MTALLTSLIDKQDTLEIIRDQIAAILFVESANQVVLAGAAGKTEPELWALRVFSGRNRAWDVFNEDPDQSDAIPVVNVSFSRASVDLSGSDVVESQKFVGTFWIDCYGYGLSQNDISSGHVSGDAKAEDEAHRALRLVRNILMAGTYTYLDLPRGTVWRRMSESMEIFDLPIDLKPAQNIRGARLTLEVVFNELSPQVEGQLIDIVNVNVKRAETGEVYFVAQYGDS